METTTARPSDEAVRYKTHPRHEMLFSVDLGKKADHTAYIIAEARPRQETNLADQNITVMEIEVLNIVRFEIAPDSTTFYKDVARHLYTVHGDPRLWLRKIANHAPVPPEFLLDTGGPGEPVADDLERSMHIHGIRYQLVRGTSRVTRHGRRRWTVPRPWMFQQLDTAFSNNRIIVDPRLKWAEELIKELSNLKREVNEETGSVRVTHREGSEHDDLAISLAAAVWWVNQPKPVDTLRVVR
jgi:hypothetical protein